MSSCIGVLLTVLVTDIVGSTEKAAAMGDLKWKGLLQSYDAAVRRDLKNFDGGDSLEFRREWRDSSGNLVSSGLACKADTGERSVMTMPAKPAT